MVFRGKILAVHLRDGYPVPPGLDLPKAKKRIETLYKEKGEFTTQIAYEEMKKSNSPLHCIGVWDADAAIEECNRARARQFVGAVTVDVQLPERTEPVTLRAFVHLPSDETREGSAHAEGTYVPFEELSKEELHQRAIQQGLRELASFERRWGSVVEFQPIFKQRAKLAAQYASVAEAAE